MPTTSGECPDGTSNACGYLFVVLQSVYERATLLTSCTAVRRTVLFMPNTHRRRRRDATKQFRRVGVGVGGVYWALG